MNAAYSCERGGRITQLQYLLQLSCRTSENCVKAKFALFHRPAPDRILCKQGHEPVMFIKKPRPAQARRRKCRAPGGISCKIVNPNFAESPECELRLNGVLGSSALLLCSRAYTLASHRSMMRSLRDQLRPHEGAGQLPV